MISLLLVMNRLIEWIFLLVLLKYCEDKQSIDCIYNSILWSPVYNILIFFDHMAHPCPIKCNTSHLKRGKTVPCVSMHGHLKQKQLWTSAATLGFKGRTIKFTYNERYGLWSLFVKTNLLYSTVIYRMLHTHTHTCIAVCCVKYVTFPSYLLCASNR
jgi:hypothetical protein